MRFPNALRRALAAAALVSTAALAGCDATETLLEVRDPDIIDPADVNSPAAANALRLGALARLNTSTSGGESTWLLGGLLADEYRSSDTFLQRNETDRRAIQTSNAQVTTAFRNLHRARLSAVQAIPALRQWEAPAWQIAQMYVVQAFVENQLAEDFCGHIPFSSVENGLPVPGAALSTTASFERALAHVDSALAEIQGVTTANANNIRNMASVVKGRILVNLERYAEAAQAVAGVPTGYEFQVEYSANTGTNEIWSLNNNIGRWYVSQGEGTNGLNFAVNDPRLPICRVTTTGYVNCAADTPVEEPFDPSTPVIGGNLILVQQKWPTRYTPVAVVTGVEARLIEAEAALAAGDYPGMLTILNALRATVDTDGNPATIDLAPLAPVATTAERENQLFRERAFWLFGTGHRLGDLRRLIRDYGRTAESTFPTGAWWKGGNYGTDVNMPVPQAEENNQNFSRASCSTTTA